MRKENLNKNNELFNWLHCITAKDVNSCTVNFMRSTMMAAMMLIAQRWERVGEQSFVSGCTLCFRLYSSFPVHTPQPVSVTNVTRILLLLSLLVVFEYVIKMTVSFTSFHTCFNLVSCLFTFFIFGILAIVDSLSFRELFNLTLYSLILYVGFVITSRRLPKYNTKPSGALGKARHK